MVIFRKMRLNVVAMEVMITPISYVDSMLYHFQYSRYSIFCTLQLPADLKTMGLTSVLPTCGLIITIRCEVRIVVSSKSVGFWAHKYNTNLAIHSNRTHCNQFKGYCSWISVETTVLWIIKLHWNGFVVTMDKINQWQTSPDWYCSDSSKRHSPILQMCTEIKLTGVKMFDCWSNKEVKLWMWVHLIHSTTEFYRTIAQ